MPAERPSQSPPDAAAVSSRMRWTPHTLIVLGMGLFLYSLWSLSAAAMADGAQASERHFARLVIQNMSVEEIRGVFIVPPQVKDMSGWIEHSVGSGFSSWVARYISANILVLGILGVTQVGWGVCELASRSRAAA